MPISRSATSIARPACCKTCSAGANAGAAQNGGETIHVGDEASYIAVYTDRQPHARFAKGAPLNHLGIVVDDLGAAEEVVLAAGLEPFSHADYEPGRRFYFFDWDGIEFEVVSYA
jgi:catechol 2,3-dioxygenase-like lactoylglutathione lyase family enzyme